MRKLEFPGSITQDRGRHRARVMVGGQRIPVGTFDTWDEAAGAIAEFWRLRAAEEVAAGAGIQSLRTWGETYLDIRETDGQHRDVDSDRSRWRARIASKPIGAMSLDTIQPRDVRAWLADQIREPSARGKPSGVTTIKNALNLLRVALEAAVEKELIPSNPARSVRMPRLARSETDEAWDWLRADEIGRLLALPALTAEQRRVFTVALYTGLRKGELWGLRWRDVDLAGAQLTVRRSYDGPTKGGRSRRVPLLKPALEAIREQHALPRLCSQVFPGPGPVMRNEYDSLGLEEALEAAKVRRIRFHDLRHTCASHLVQGTWAPEHIERSLRLEEVKEWLGHKSISTTQRYSHLCPEAVAALVKKPRPPTATRDTGTLDAAASQRSTAHGSRSAGVVRIQIKRPTSTTAPKAWPSIRNGWAAAASTDSSRMSGQNHRLGTRSTESTTRVATSPATSDGQRALNSSATGAPTTGSPPVERRFACRTGPIGSESATPRYSDGSSADGRPSSPLPFQQARNVCQKDAFQGVAARWPQVAAGAAGRARQVLGIIEAQTGFEPVYDGFANRASLPVVLGGSAVPRASRDRILELLAIYARGESPPDVQIVDALAEAAWLLGAVEARRHA